MHFVIQTIDRKILHDFSFTLLEAIEYQRWCGNEVTCMFYDNDARASSGIPVGSIEFVCESLALQGYPVPKPRNVPSELFKFAGRNIFNGAEKDSPNGASFAKSNDKIKDVIHETLMVYELDASLPKGNYQFSSIVDFISEWRAFVWRGELVGLQNYSGEFTMFPDVDRIREMIKTFKSAPCAYTLDVGIIKDQTCVVEVHDFFSCGLYGFADLQLLPLMLAGWYREYIKCQKK
jgi:hypothetical protein